MKTEALNCRCCGGVLNVTSIICKCDYCGATNIISDIAGKYINQLNRANKLRQAREFDNALRIYDIILSENKPTVDLLWARTLCEYGIEYVPDPLSHKYIPTLHRVKDESILEYPSYKEAYELADDEQKEILKSEAEYIGNIQTKYLNIAAKESPYDIFICYKETDERTKEKTLDTQIAQDLYDKLTDMGYKVFFAKETLKSKLSVDYEPYIFAALKSSKVMAVVGTKSEYFMSVWVKNEWGRFLKLMDKDPQKQMFFACDDPEELPRAFALKQVQLLSEEDAITNFANNISDYLAKISDKIKKPKIKDFETLKKEKFENDYNRILSLAKKGDMTLARTEIGSCLNSYPDSAKFVWLALCIDNNRTPDNIDSLKEDITKNKYYKAAIDCCKSEEEKNEYIKKAEQCKNQYMSQVDLNKLVTERSKEYADGFSENPIGEKMRSISNDIYKDINKIKTNQKLGMMLSVIGIILTVIGVLLFIICEGRLIANATGIYLLLPFICAFLLLHIGLLLVFSYNIKLNIIINVLLFGMMLYFTVTDIKNSTTIGGYAILIAIPVLFVIAVLTGKGIKTNRVNKKFILLKNDILSKLDELETEKENAGTQIRAQMNLLLSEFSKERGIKDNLLGIRKEDCSVAFDEVNRRYNEILEICQYYIDMKNENELNKAAHR